jgi:flagellar L-ring protein precursor FlgH
MAPRDPWDTSHLQVAHTPGEHKPRTFHEHDLIEVLVRENSRSERTAELSTQRRADLNAGINQWPNFRALLNEQRQQSYTQGLPAIAGTIQNRHETEGEFEREDSFTARVMAEVAQVLPNGNLILEARSVTEVVRGRCRAEDISQLNTVYSTQLHDLEVTQHSEGELRRASSKPWITRLLETVFGV